LAGQQLAGQLQSTGVGQQLQAQLSGLGQQANLRSLGLAGNLQAQQEALAGLLNSRRDVANQILGNQGTLGGIAGNLLGGLLNPSITSGYDQATLNALGQSGAGVGYGGFVL
jgi:outer membrane lipoprotein SlyB